MTKKITKYTVLEEVLKIDGAQEVLTKFNFPCLTCPMAKIEMNILKVGQVCDMYGIDSEKLLNELNEECCK